MAGLQPTRGSIVSVKNNRFKWSRIETNVTCVVLVNSWWYAVRLARRIVRECGGMMNSRESRITKCARDKYTWRETRRLYDSINFYDNKFDFLANSLQGRIQEGQRRGESKAPGAELLEIRWKSHRFDDLFFILFLIVVFWNILATTFWRVKKLKSK